MKKPQQSTPFPSQQDPSSSTFKKKALRINPDQIYALDSNPIDIKFILRENYVLKELIKLLEEQIKLLKAKIPPQEIQQESQNQPLDLMKFKIERSNSLVVIENPSEMSSEQNSAFIHSFQRKQSVVNVQTGSNRSMSPNKELVNIFQNSNVTISVIDSENDDNLKKSLENLSRGKTREDKFVIIQGNKVNIEREKGSQRVIKYEEGSVERKNIDFMASNATEFLEYDMNHELESILDQDNDQLIEESTVLGGLSAQYRSPLKKTHNILKKSSLNITKAKKVMRQTEQISEETDEHDDDEDQQQQRVTTGFTIRAKRIQEGKNSSQLSKNLSKNLSFLKINGETQGAIESDGSTPLDSSKTTGMKSASSPDTTVGNLSGTPIGYIKLVDNKRQSQLSEIKQNISKDHEQNQEIQQQAENQKPTSPLNQDIKIKYESIIRKLLEKITAISNKNQQLSSLISGLRNKFKSMDDRAELSWPMTRKKKDLQKLREQSKQCSFEDEKQAKIPHYIHRKQRVKQIKAHNFHKYS